MAIRGEGGFRSNWQPALWLVADAALAAILAWPTEALLLFVLSPDLPFTPNGMLATMVALLPQVLAVFVLAGPLLVLFGTSLAVGRTTRRGLSVRYVLRFALLDSLLLALAASRQWFYVGHLLPDMARSALGLMVTTLLVSAASALVLSIVDHRRPGKVGAPWVVGLGILVTISLGIAGDLRRVRIPDPQPVDLPGFQPERALLVVEIPGLSLKDLDEYMKPGSVPALERLAGRGVTGLVQGRPLSDPVALHVTLTTGREPLQHGVLASVRYRPVTGRLSFAIFPRGLLLRPLLLTPLWVKEPVDARAVRAVTLPGIAQALRLPVALVGAPLGGRLNGGLVISRGQLRPGRRPLADRGDRTWSCGPAPLAAGQLFDPPAGDLGTTAELGQEATSALAEDLCALEAARRILAAPDRPSITFVRLSGYGRVAWQFAGWRADSPARGALDREIAAYGRTMVRYIRALDPALGNLFEAAGPDSFVAVVSPVGVEARQDIGAVVSTLLGQVGPTGTFAGPPPGLFLFVGPGLAHGGKATETLPLTGVLPTLLWAQGLPAGEDMGPIARSLFDPPFSEAHPPVTLQSFSRR